MYTIARKGVKGFIKVRQQSLRVGDYCLKNKTNVTRIWGMIPIFGKITLQ